MPHTTARQFCPRSIVHEQTFFCIQMPPASCFRSPIPFSHLPLSRQLVLLQFGVDLLYVCMHESCKTVDCVPMCRRRNELWRKPLMRLWKPAQQLRLSTLPSLSSWPWKTAACRSNLLRSADFEPCIQQSFLFCIATHTTSTHTLPFVDERTLDKLHLALLTIKTPLWRATFVTAYISIFSVTCLTHSFTLSCFPA